MPLWPAGHDLMDSAMDCSTETIDAFVACRIWQSTVLHLLGISRVWDQADASYVQAGGC